MYGFLDPEELSLFELLISVSGIGPKNALNVISNVDPAKLQAAIIKGDAEYLHKVGGLGPKTAERLVLELKGKFKAAGRKVNLSAESEALDALVSLGYNRSQALEALGKVKGGAGTEAKVKEALKLLSGR
jgi:Holliday junction DNA helicase RuvA